MSTPTDRALEPCPFCGAAVELRWDDEHGYGGFVACSTTDCPVSPTGKHDKAATIAAWNRRAAEIDASKPAPAECSHYFPMDPRKCVRCGWDFRNGEPAHAEAAEALPWKWDDEAAWALAKKAEALGAERDSDDNGTWWTIRIEQFNALATALAARPAAAGGAEPVAVGLITETTDGWLDNVQLTEAGKRLPVGEHKFYTARPAAVGGELPIKRYTHELVGSYVHWEVRPHEDKNGVWCKYSDVWSHWLTLTTQPQQLAVTDEAVKCVEEYMWRNHGVSIGLTATRYALTAALPHLARKETT